jgi:hypothetical protein
MSVKWHINKQPFPAGFLLITLLSNKIAMTLTPTYVDPLDYTESGAVQAGSFLCRSLRRVRPSVRY